MLIDFDWVGAHGIGRHRISQYHEPQPNEVNNYTAMSGIRAGSTRDDHDVRSTEITEDEVLGVK